MNFGQILGFINLITNFGPHNLIICTQLLTFVEFRSGKKKKDPGHLTPLSVNSHLRLDLVNADLLYIYLRGGLALAPNTGEEERLKLGTCGGLYSLSMKSI